MQRLHNVQTATWLLLSGFASVCLVGLMFIAITWFALHAAGDHDQMARLQTSTGVARHMLHRLGPDFRSTDGRLFAGDTLLNGNDAVIDSIQTLVGGIVTIFDGDTRIATNLRGGDGRRMIGTRLADPAVRSAVVDRGQPFRGIATIQGVRHYASYERIADANGRQIGLLAVAMPETKVMAATRRSAVLAVALAVVMVGLVSILFAVIGRRLTAQIRSRQISAQVAHRLLDAALTNMADGLTLWDADGRLVLFNAQACRMLDLADTDMAMGMTFRDFLRIRHARGAFGSESFDDVYHKRMAVMARSEPSLMIDRWQDGRVINVQHRAMPDGGWIATYEDVTERHEADARIDFMAHYDPLTGLGNRAQFDQYLQQVLTRAAGQGRQVAVLNLDLDRFKPVNDGLGHAIGDKLLVAVARRLMACVRSGDIVARLGGDEFAVVTPLGDADPASCAALAERINQHLAEPFHIDNQPIAIGVSIGIALFPNDGATGGELLRCADIAMYRAKMDGRGSFRMFKPTMDEDLQDRRALERDLRGVVAAGGLDLAYQPLVSCRSGAVEGYEALLRWNHPERGPIPPSVFVTLAEDIGLIGKLGQWVLETACAAAVGWPDGMRVAINLSPQQFKQRGLANTILATLSRTGLAASRLEVEVTEGVMIDDPAGAARVLSALRAAGVRVSLDDFGTGYSSLSYLRKFPLDKIKIDKSFIDDMAHDPQCASIVRTLVSLAHTLNLSVTAEGVETAEQLAALQGQACDQVQGYLLGRPMPDRYRAPATTAAPQTQPAAERELVA